MLNFYIVMEVFKGVALCTLALAEGQSSLIELKRKCFLSVALGSYIASFYLDPYSRPSEKRGGAWMAPAICK